MVMKRSMMAKNLRQSIFRSMGRFIAIAVIIALGAAIFVGLRTTKADMVATGQKYTDAQNMFDLRLLSTYGWSRNQVHAVAGMEGVKTRRVSPKLTARGRGDCHNNCQLSTVNCQLQQEVYDEYTITICLECEDSGHRC